jgi:hypothetical protein
MLGSGLYCSTSCRREHAQDGGSCANSSNAASECDRWRQHRRPRTRKTGCDIRRETLELGRATAGPAGGLGRIRGVAPDPVVLVDLARRSAGPLSRTAGSRSSIGTPQRRRYLLSFRFPRRGRQFSKLCQISRQGSLTGPRTAGLPRPAGNGCASLQYRLLEAEIPTYHRVRKAGRCRAKGTLIERLSSNGRIRAPSGPGRRARSELEKRYTSSGATDRLTKTGNGLFDHSWYVECAGGEAGLEKWVVAKSGSGRWA